MRPLNEQNENNQINQLFQSIIDIFSGDLTVIDPDMVKAFVKLDIHKSLSQ